MYNPKAIETIKKLLQENTEASLTYAALECRLAIELICYSRLRVAHDYISHDDLRAWQPRQIIDALIQNVDPRAASIFTLSISKEPLGSNADDPTAEDYSETNWVEVGTQVGFDPKRLGKLWNKLANAALHVKIPKGSADELRRYGDPELIREAVLDALAEIERIDASTLTLGGTGASMSFKCSCGIMNKRRLALLKDRQIVNCISPRCYESYVYLSETKEFQRRNFPVQCVSCGEEKFVPIMYMEKELKVGSRLGVRCECSGETYIEWRLMQAQKPTSA
ncbi:hypothetical protein [Neorhizobium sp. DAR64872/K0K18]|uniref:hypothetical protein n=1 Tax=Neorhizobium sp. DAR64872/K0K18 TaxID=3421958 RepID=UPI003D282FB0